MDHVADAERDVRRFLHTNCRHGVGSPWGSGPVTLERLQHPTIRVVDPQEVDRSVIASDSEVSVVRAEPAVDHLDDLDAPAVDLEPPRRFLTAVSGVALDLPAEAKRMPGGEVITLSRENRERLPAQVAARLAAGRGV